LTSAVFVRHRAARPLLPGTSRRFRHPENSRKISIGAARRTTARLVNEVMPRAKLLERAWKIADHIMTQQRTTRRMTTQIVRRPWRRQITDSLDSGFAMQMFAHLAKKTAAHGRSHIGDAVAYVRKGKRNNFDQQLNSGGDVCRAAPGPCAATLVGAPVLALNRADAQ
jgi:hypothetical protein